MDFETHRIREALRGQGITQEDLARRLGKSRQTVNRYLNQYERSGTVGDAEAKAEFDRIMALERQHLLSLENNDGRLERIKARKEVLDRNEEENTAECERLLREILANHPDEPMYDYEGKVVTPETLDLKDMWVNDIDNKPLMAALTPLERARWDRLSEKMGKNFGELCRNRRLEEACILEKLWDATDPRGKPILYHDEFQYVDAGAEMDFKPYHFECDTLCMCSGGTARIYAEDLFPPDFEHNVEFEVYAVIEVVTDQGLFHIDTVKLEAPRVPFRFVGQTDGLIPGYKYVYSLSIGAGDYDEVNEQEYTLLEGYYGPSHPLKRWSVSRLKPHDPARAMHEEA